MKKVFTKQKITKIKYLPLLVAGFFLCAALPLPPYKYGFSDYKSGYKPIAKLTHNGTRIICYNQTVPQMYSIALCNGNPITIKRSLFNEKVSELYDRKYCYELIVPRELKDSIYKIMHKNLQDKFPDLIASVVKISNVNYLKIERKEDGVIISPIVKDYTY